MNSGRNHIDQWLQQSAEMGNAAFREADWQHMQQLLQPKKKRRFIIFWWLTGLLAGGSLCIYLFLGNGGKMEEKKEQAFIDNREKSIKEEQVVNAHDSVGALSRETKNHHDGKEALVSTNPSGNKTPINDRIEKEELEHHKIQQQISPKSIKTKSNKALSGKHSKQNVYTGIAVHTVGSTTTVLDSVKPAPISNDVDTSRFHWGELASIGLNLSINPIRINDSIPKKNLSNSTAATKKKQQPNKNEWAFAAGYYTGNLPLRSNGLNARIGYSISLGSFFVQPSIGASSFNPNKGQVHQSISIRQSTGTTMAEVKTTNTYFTPANGFVLHPSLSFGWQTKQARVYAGLQQNIVLNTANRTDRTTMDSAYFTVLPPGIVATKSYDASLFNGSKSLSLHVGIKYNIGKRWFANMEYSSMLDYNTVEGIVDEKKRRMAFSLLLGIRF